MKNPFHLAIPVHDLIKANNFYQNILGCERGRSSESWIDFDLFGHQLVCHHSKNMHKEITNPVDGDIVPVPHFGVVLAWEDWTKLAERLQRKRIKFVMAPTIRFQGKVGEQATMFFNDPEGNALEFKAFKDMSQLFAE